MKAVIRLECIGNVSEPRYVQSVHIRNWVHIDSQSIIRVVKVHICKTLWPTNLCLFNIMFNYISIRYPKQKFHWSNLDGHQTAFFCTNRSRYKTLSGSTDMILETTKPFTKFQALSQQVFIPKITFPDFYEFIKVQRFIVFQGVVHFQISPPLTSQSRNKRTMAV